MNDIAPLVEALALIDGGSCESFVGRHGPGYFCFENGRVSSARFTADQACDSCLAHRAREQWINQMPTEMPNPNSVPRIVTQGDVMVLTYDGWVLIEREDPDTGRGPWASTFTTLDEQPLTTPVFGPPDMGTRALPQPPAPGVLDRIEIRFRRDGFDLHCPDCGKWLNAWTRFGHAPTALAEILDLLSWLPGAGYEIHDCEAR